MNKHVLRQIEVLQEILARPIITEEEQSRIRVKAESTRDMNLLLGILMNSQGRRNNMRDCVNCPNKKWQVVDKQPRMYCGYLGKEVKLAESNEIARLCPSFKEAEVLPKHDKY